MADECGDGDFAASRVRRRRRGNGDAASEDLTAVAERPGPDRHAGL
ncbi:MAG: hypothetical protein QOK29_5088, partial [Rhodospirillaceae bacterium]|nr:hypothetical protein [Rhodospirillaceae bacterium]